jgi:hypothetical protein
MRQMLRETTLFGKTYYWDQTDPDHVKFMNPTIIVRVLREVTQRIKSTMSTPGGFAVQEGALTGNKPSSGASSGDWA